MAVEQEKRQETIEETMRDVLAKQQAKALPSDPVSDPPDEQAAAEAPPEGDAQDPEPEAADPGGEDSDSPPSDSEPESQTPPAFEALQHWSNEDKERFAALDDGAKEFVLDRAKALEKTQLQKHRELDAQARQYDAVMGALAPFKEQMARSGVQPEQAIAQLASRWTQLNQAPGEAVGELLRQYGPSLGEEDARNLAHTLLTAKGLSTDALLDEHSPELDSPEAKAIAELKREIQELKAEARSSREQSQQSQESEADRAMQAFVAAQNDDGTPKHPHFELLTPNISRILVDRDERVDAFASPATRLKQAYDAALADMTSTFVPAKPKPNGKRKVASTVARSSPAPGQVARELAKSHEEELRNVARERGMRLN